MGKSASRQSASQCCTGAGTCNVDHDAQSRTTRTSDAATSITILSLTLLPQPTSITVRPSTSGLCLSTCAPPRYLQSLRGKNTTRKWNVHSKGIQLLPRGSPRTGGGVTPTSGACVFPLLRLPFSSVGIQRRPSHLALDLLTTKMCEQSFARRRRPMPIRSCWLFRSAH